jgi:hypothetical protein
LPFFAIPSARLEAEDFTEPPAFIFTVPPAFFAFFTTISESDSLYLLGQAESFMYFCGAWTSRLLTQAS